MEVRWVMSPASTFKEILAVSQTISTESEMSPAANALGQQSPVSKYLFRRDALLLLHFCSLGGIDLQIGLKYVETLN